MLKLLKSDIKTILRNRSMVLLIVLSIPFISIILPSESYQKIGLLYLATTILVIYNFPEERDVQPEKLILSLPVTRNELVASKYLIVPLIIIFNIILISLNGFILEFLGIDNHLTTSMADKTISILLISIILSLCLPWFFALSTNIAQGISIFIVLSSQNYMVDNSQEFFGELYIKYGSLALIGLSLLILGISAYFSTLIYKNRNF